MPHEEPHVTFQQATANTETKKPRDVRRCGTDSLFDQYSSAISVRDLRSNTVRNIFLAHLIKMQILIIHTLLKIIIIKKTPNHQKQMRQSPPRSAAQLGRLRRGPFGFACASSQLPPPGTGQHPNPGRSPPRSIPLPHAAHPAQPGARPFCHPLPPSERLLQMGSFISTTTSLIRLYGAAASTGSFARATATGPGPGCPPGAPGARSSLPGGPGADGRRAAVQGCRTDTGGMPGVRAHGWLFLWPPTARDPPGAAPGPGELLQGGGLSRAGSRSSASCLPLR